MITDFIRSKRKKIGSNSVEQVNKKKVGKTSQFFGVSWNKTKQRWYAKTTVNYRTKHLGLFEDERDAAIAYIKALIKRFGPDVRLEDQQKLGLR